MKMGILEKSKKTRNIAMLTIVIVTFAVGIMYLSQPQIESHVNFNSHPFNGMTMAPSMSLSGWGHQVSSFDSLKSITDLSESLPTYLPDNLKLDSTLVKGDSRITLITQVYVPRDATTKYTTFNELIDNGMAVMYTYDKGGGSTFKHQQIQDLVNFYPTGRQLDVIHGHDAMIVNGPKSEVYVFVSNSTMIDIVSVKYGVSELKKVAESISP